MIESRQALITGGNGFFGEHLSKKLSQKGFSCRSFDLKDGWDITNRPQVSESIKTGDVVFHLAGILGTHELNESSYEATQINVLGTINVFDAAKSRNSRLVLAAKPNPWLNTYSITKEAAEKFMQMYSEIFGCDFRAGRFFSLYGGGQKTKEHGVQKAVPTFIMQALGNEPLTIFGTGKQTADFIYASDAAEAFVRLGTINGLKGEVIDIGTGEETEITHLAEMIIKFADSKSKIAYIPMRSGEPLNARVVADPTKMKNLLHFTPNVSLEDGLKETVRWYKSNVFGKAVFFSSLLPSGK